MQTETVSLTVWQGAIAWPAAQEVAANTNAQGKQTATSVAQEGSATSTAPKMPIALFVALEGDAFLTALERQIAAEPALRAVREMASTSPEQSPKGRDDRRVVMTRATI